MSTATHDAPVRPAVTGDTSVATVPFSRVLRVELRKLVDTRAGFWLLAAIGIITIAVVVVFLVVYVVFLCSGMLISSVGRRIEESLRRV